ncbi:hypothetical protein SAMN02746095_03853, partial [Acidocella aminolytica 101 = DSM 11237]
MWSHGPGSCDHIYFCSGSAERLPALAGRGPIAADAATAGRGGA